MEPFSGHVPIGINMMEFSFVGICEVKALGLDLEKELVLGFSRRKSNERVSFRRRTGKLFADVIIIASGR